jgi:hypothetical protein
VVVVVVVAVVVVGGIVVVVGAVVVVAVVVGGTEVVGAGATVDVVVELELLAITTRATTRPITAATSTASAHLTLRLIPPGGGPGSSMRRVGSSCTATSSSVARHFRGSAQAA